MYKTIICFAMENVKNYNLQKATWTPLVKPNDFQFFTRLPTLNTHANIQTQP